LILHYCILQYFDCAELNVPAIQYTRQLTELSVEGFAMVQNLYSSLKNAIHESHKLPWAAIVACTTKDAALHVAWRTKWPFDNSDANCAVDALFGMCDTERCFYTRFSIAEQSHIIITSSLCRL
jgi:hypothetical protein